MTEDLRAKTCCFTGHRRIPEEALPRLERRLNEELEALAARGVIYFGAGGALGFDTLAAEAVIRLQRTRPQVKLILVLPSPDQTRGWSSGNVRRYEAIRARANKVMYVASTYGPGCLFERNRRLVDGSGICLCYLTAETGGSAYTVRYARKQGLPVINLAETER